MRTPPKSYQVSLALELFNLIKEDIQKVLSVEYYKDIDNDEYLILVDKIGKFINEEKKDGYSNMTVKIITKKNEVIYNSKKEDLYYVYTQKPTQDMRNAYSSSGGMATYYELIGRREREYITMTVENSKGEFIGFLQIYFTFILR